MLSPMRLYIAHMAFLSATAKRNMHHTHTQHPTAVVFRAVRGDTAYWLPGDMLRTLGTAHARRRSWPGPLAHLPPWRTRRVPPAQGSAEAAARPAARAQPRARSASRPAAAAAAAPRAAAPAAAAPAPHRATAGGTAPAQPAQGMAYQKAHAAKSVDDSNVDPNQSRRTPSCSSRAHFPRGITATTGL